MQHVSRFRCQQTSRAYSSAQPSGHALPHPVQPRFRGARPCITHATPETADAGSSGEDQPVVRRRRLFRAGSGTSTTSSSSTGVGSNASTASRKRPASQGAEASQEDVLDSFAAAFESMAVSPKKASRPPPQYNSSSRRSADGEDLSFLSGDPALRTDLRDRSFAGRGGGRFSGGRGSSSSSSGRGSGAASLFGRSPGGSSYGSLMNKDGPGWGARGKGKDKDKKPMSLKELEEIDVEGLSPEKQRLLEQLKAEANEAERKRLLRKARSERIPTAPSKKQDPVLFQALTREWDEKRSLEELRGARAAARQVARVGLYDRNRALKAVRRKAVQALDKKDPSELTEEDVIIAARAKEIREAAASKSIQKTKEVLAEEAKGVPRSYARAEALPEGMWEELQEKYRTDVPQIKIGRRGATEALIGSIHAVWRNHECVKLRIHDDKSARKMNLPRVNLLLRELEEMSGGVLLDCQGSSIWLYRGLDWVPPPVPPAYKPPPQEDQLQQQYTPKGSWQDIGGVTCYVASSGSSDGSSGSNDDSSGSSGGVQPAASDTMTVLMLPDHFALADSKALLQVADKMAVKGILVVLADVLGAPPDSVNSNMAKKGEAAALWKGTQYWPAHRWPLVKKRKLEYMEWFQTGPGSWQQQRPKLLQLLEAMQQQGLYDPEATLQDPPSPAIAAADTDPDADTDTAAAGEEEEAAADSAASSSSSSTSSRVSGRPLGLLGIGWGSFIGLHAAGDDTVVAAGAKVLVALSPATYNKDYDITTKLQLPVCLLPAKYDTMDQMMMFINLLAKPWEKRCVFKRFGKVKPGWGSWLPQWNDPRAMRQVAEQMLTAVSYLRRELLGLQDGYDLPEPQLPAKAGAASQADVDKAAAQAEKKAAAELAEAQAEARQE